MKINIVLLTAAASLMSALSSQAAQTYLNVGADNIGPSGMYIYHDADGSPFADLSRSVSTTLVIDSENLTARYSGAVSAATANLSYTTRVWSQQVGTITQFPNPPEPVYVDGYATISLSVVTDAFTFDTGDQNIVWNGAGYSIASQTLATITGNFSMTFAVTSGGETATRIENWTGDLVFATSGKLNLSGYPDTASLVVWTSFGRTFTQVAPNGFTSTITIVPEPSSVAMGALGALVLFRRRRR